MESFITTLLAPLNQAFAKADAINASVTMPVDRIDGFRKSVAAKLREGAARGIAEPAIIATVVAEQTALAKAVADPSFVMAMTMGYQLEMRQQNPNPAYTVSAAEAQRAVTSILRNRIADMQQFIHLLAQPDFIASTRAEALTPTPPATPYQLPARKVTEEVTRLVQQPGGAGAEPAVHVAATAIGHQVVHQALANIFRPEGPLRPHLVHALATAWPQASAEGIEQLAGSWLKARHDPAHAITDALKPSGAIYVAAMQLSETLQQQKLTAASAARTAATPAPAPSPQIMTPRAVQGKVRTTTDLVMEV